MKISCQVHRNTISMLLIVASCLSARPAWGDLIFVSSRSQLGGEDTIDWGDGTNWNVLETSSNSVSAFTILSDNGVVATVRSSNGLNVFTAALGGVSPPFAPNENILDPFNGQVVISFDKDIVAAGADFSTLDAALSQNLNFGSGSLRGKIEALDGEGGVLFGYTVNMDSTSTFREFLGVADDGSGIAFRGIRFSGIFQPGDLWGNSILLNSLDFTLAPTNVIPEPSSSGLLGVAVVSLIARRRWRAS
jgi:hypothetical protein